MSPPYFTGRTGPVDFGALGLPGPDDPGHRKLYVRDGSRYVEYGTEPTRPAEPVTSHANGSTFVGGGRARSSITTEYVLEDTPTRVVRRRGYADGRTVWVIRPRTMGSRIEVYEAGEPRHADLEAEYRRRAATGDPDLFGDYENTYR
jgi:hypothetical protein